MCLHDVAIGSIEKRIPMIFEVKKQRSNWSKSKPFSLFIGIWRFLTNIDHTYFSTWAHGRGISHFKITKGGLLFWNKGNLPFTVFFSFHYNKMSKLYDVYHFWYHRPCWPILRCYYTIHYVFLVLKKLICLYACP